MIEGENISYQIPLSSEYTEEKSTLTLNAVYTHTPLTFAYWILHTGYCSSAFFILYYYFIFIIFIKYYYF